jgi:methylphosphotriester-DNA--protein-cysteine methyltransferase
MSWTNRVRHSPGTPALRQVKEAAENLADQAGIAPGKARVVFQTVVDVTIITSADSQRSR